MELFSTQILSSYNLIARNFLSNNGSSDHFLNASCNIIPSASKRPETFCNTFVVTSGGNRTRDLLIHEACTRSLSHNSIPRTFTTAAEQLTQLKVFGFDLILTTKALTDRSIGSDDQREASFRGFDNVLVGRST